jgi:hypothetical protein
MAVVPYLASLGGKLAGLFEKNSIAALQPPKDEGDSEKMSGHVIVLGYGRWVRPPTTDPPPQAARTQLAGCGLLGLLVAALVADTELSLCASLRRCFVLAAGLASPSPSCWQSRGFRSWRSTRAQTVCR